MRFIVCGGRKFTNWEMLDHTLTRLHAKCGITEIIHGDALGADIMAGQWGKQHGIKVRPVPAIWRPNGRLDRGAGPKRNRKMLAMAPDGVVAFPGGPGTADMVAISEMAGIKVWKVK